MPLQHLRLYDYGLKRQNLIQAQTPGVLQAAVWSLQPEEFAHAAEEPSGLNPDPRGRGHFVSKPEAAAWMVINSQRQLSDR